MTFDDFSTISAEQDFVLTSGAPGSKEYVFENSAGNKLHIRNLNNSLADTFPMWTVDIDGDRVQFDNPSQVLSVNTILTGLVSRSIQALKKDLNA